VTRVSEHFTLGLSQPQLDFVDVDVATDTEVYVDPHALRQLRTEWGRECVALLRAYFGCVLTAIRTGNTARADELLGQLREPNQTRLGLSRGRPAGHALGPNLAADVRDQLARSEALRTGLIEDLEDTILMIPLIGRDLISDITTNVIREPLIRYTQQVCDDLGIPTEEGVYAGPVWEPDTQEWSQGYATLPWVGDYALLLVPKVIVRRKMDFEAYDYYNRYIIPFLQEEEIRAGTELVRLLKGTGEPRVDKQDVKEKYGHGKAFNEEMTRAHPQLLRDYRRTKRRHAPPAIPHDGLAGITGTTPPDFDALLGAIATVPPGNAGASRYHRAVEALVTPLFYPWLTGLAHEAEIHQGRKRIDIRFDNTATAGFFDLLGRRYVVPYVFAECKNYAEDPVNPPLDQLSGRFSPRRGNFGLLICRTIADKVTFAARCRDTADDGRGYIIGLDDADLAALVAARLADNELDPLRLLRRRFNALVN
jgi:hypothetical protein